MTDEEMAEKYFKSVCKDYNEEKERTGERHYWVGFDLKNAFLAGLKAGRPQWHKLDWEKDFPDVDKLVRVRTKSGAEYICETYSYFPAENEIGYGSVITQFAELNGDWVDDNEIEYWCYIEPFKESE